MSENRKVAVPSGSGRDGKSVAKRDFIVPSPASRSRVWGFSTTRSIRPCRSTDRSRIDWPPPLGLPRSLSESFSDGETNRPHHDASTRADRTYRSRRTPLRSIRNGCARHEGPGLRISRSRDVNLAAFRLFLPGICMPHPGGTRVAWSTSGPVLCGPQPVTPTRSWQAASRRCHTSPARCRAPR